MIYFNIGSSTALDFFKKEMETAERDDENYAVVDNWRIVRNREHFFGTTQSISTLSSSSNIEMAEEAYVDDIIEIKLTMLNNCPELFINCFQNLVTRIGISQLCFREVLHVWIVHTAKSTTTIWSDYPNATIAVREIRN